jgi:lipopolysaccharide/colanic/teichoic acid biosynthesis glycosyltransferase
MGDTRITAIGRVLRRTKIDEIPQLINVVRGEMSLVGPRPESPEFVAHYTPAQRKVLTVRPGVTGPATLAFIDEEELLPEGETTDHYLAAVMPRKLELDLEYVRTATFGGDLKILGQTAVAVVGRLFRRRKR